MVITLSNGDEDEVVRVPYPDRSEGQMFAIAENMLGGARVRVICEDGKSRLGRIPGKLKKRMWIREDDLLIVDPWDFQMRNVTLNIVTPEPRSTIYVKRTTYPTV